MLDPSRYAAVKAAIVADGTMGPLAAAGSFGQVADFANGPAAPVVKIYRPNVSVAQLNGAIDWGVFSTLAEGLQLTYMAMTQGGSVDATQANVRSGFMTVFGAGSSSLIALVAVAQKSASRYEALFTTAGVSAVFGQTLSVADVIAALGSP